MGLLHFLHYFFLCEFDSLFSFPLHTDFSISSQSLVGGIVKPFISSNLKLFCLHFSLLKSYLCKYPKDLPTSTLQQILNEIINI